MREIERILTDCEGRRVYGITVEDIEQYVIKAKEESEGLVIKKFIMTLPMDIRRSIMAHQSEELKKGLNNEK